MKHNANNSYLYIIDKLKAFLDHQAVDDRPEEIAKYPETYTAIQQIKRALSSKTPTPQEIVYWQKKLMKARQNDLRSK